MLTTITTYLTYLKARLHGENGATAAEYMGLIVVVGLILAAVGASGIGSTLGSLITNAISSVFTAASGA